MAVMAGNKEKTEWFFVCIACSPKFISDRYKIRNIAVFMEISHNKRKHQ